MKTSHWVFVALGISMAIRAFLVLLVYPDTTILTVTDQAMYLDLAEKLLDGVGLGAGFGSERVPLYPVFLASLRFITDNLFVILIIQHLIGLSIVPILFSMGNLYSGRIAVISALLAGANLNFALQSNSILTEALFYPVFAFFLLECMHYLKDRKIRRLGMAGIYLGLCTLVRTATMYLPFFMVIFLLSLKGRFMDRIRHAAIFLFTFLLVIMPWLLRNNSLYSTFSLTSQGYPHLIGWIIPSVMQYEKGMNLKAATNESVRAWNNKLEGMPQAVRENHFALDKEAKRYTIEYLLQASPLSIAKAWFWGAMKNIFSPPFIELSYMLKMEWTHFYDSSGNSFPVQALNFIFKNKNRTYSIFLFFGILIILFFRLIQTAGVWLLWRKDKTALFFFLLIIGYVLGISGPVGYAKYRLPFEPILVLFTAIAFDRFSRWKSKKVSVP